MKKSIYQLAANRRAVLNTETGVILYRDDRTTIVSGYLKQIRRKEKEDNRKTGL